MPTFASWSPIRPARALLIVVAAFAAAIDSGVTYARIPDPGVGGVAAPATQAIPVQAAAQPAAQAAPLRFAVVGDMGNGSRRQLETARQMWTQHERFPFEFVITVGDNMYGGQDPSDYEKKFVIPYKPIIDARIPFYASLGNHDKREQVKYELYNMGGRPYYTFTRGPAQFFALDSVELDHDQLRWFEGELLKSTARWRVASFHHPIYSSGIRHGPTMVLRSALEPLLSTYEVRVIFTGHEHFYERLHERHGIQQFITGSGGQLRKGGIRKGSIETANGYDQDNAFMLAEIDGDVMRFEAVSRTGAIVDSGTLQR